MRGIDIAIPCFNHGKFLTASLDSVLKQGISDVRILIIDNASTDDSADIARRLASTIPQVELILRDTNLGPHASFNTAVDWAKQDYFLILCADDLMAPGSLRRALAILEANKDIAFVYGAEFTWDNSEPLPHLDVGENESDFTIIDGKLFIESLSMPRKPIGTGSFIVRTAAQKRAGYFRPELYYTDDIEMLMRLASLGCVAEIDAIQGVRRRHGENISADYWGNWKRELQELLAAYESFFAHEGASLAWAPELRRKVRRNIAHRAYWAGVSHRMRGLKPGSAELFTFACSLEPSTRVIPPVSYWFRVENASRLFAERAKDIILSRTPHALSRKVLGS